MARNFLTSSRHGTIYYYRRRVPDDLKQLIGKPYLVKTLATAHRGTAILLPRALAVSTDALYQHLRAMKKPSNQGGLFDYTFETKQLGLALACSMAPIP